MLICLPALPGILRPGRWKAVFPGGKRKVCPVKTGRAQFPLFRQIQIGAGALVLLGLLGGLVWSPMAWLSAFVGAGLVFAGVTGFCGLGLLLARMPWNRR